ncbi:hypothetical protein [Coprococcus comes]|jgi:hypothetical protein|uniref:hypothetical protein n=1 Tax=Coprococcus comes TaxID=410072 RepID=UPI00156E2C16|nr:hypothetical protein [Coprococcus comes]MCB6474477.1 hypothetical protein [Coprococcus comes]MDC0784909.1 hypothetical protein [Coprococcus comes]MDC0788360.1 hypothetical protein [Coprococcus comes]MDC0791666.1 hypothetical protein [Coprococcus comes]MDC0795025.1 hypothetical protein [Coprococcus comes]
MDNYDSCSNYWNEMDGICVVLMGAVHSGNDRVAEKVMKHCIKTRKDIVIQQQAKPSKMQAASHIM